MPQSLYNQHNVVLVQLTDKWNRIQSPEIVLITYINKVYDKDNMSNYWGKDDLFISVTAATKPFGKR